MVYNSVNKQFLSPHKEPPSMEIVANKSKDLRSEGKEAIGREEFYQLITKWIEKDMRIVLIHRLLVALLASPLLAVQTKNLGRQLPRVGEAVEKIPTPLIATVYSAGIILLQDIRTS
ncbi:uncharacterized protein M6B38_139415 [Iris pallida]|uniref:Uncharacterized protein n=1 Tax=Iris pallida TaxID=29817 RepID=A0AAX6FCL7_IRIPA|nr:uncharacterized protein M6B38_139415 [Iris pallida]